MQDVKIAREDRSGDGTPALRDSLDRLAAILDLAEDAVISVDAGQRIVLFNHGAARIFGYQPAEVIGRPLDLLLPERYRARHRGHIEAFGHEPGQSRRMHERREIWGLRKDGSEFPAEASISKVDVGSERRYNVFLRDVTARLAAEQALRRAMAEADQAREEAVEANRAKSEFLSRMSHELRTPLNAVLGFAQLLEMDPLSPNQHANVNRILKGGRHLLDLINEVLDIARIESGRP
jgi:PAS domain S-box-containing protein